MVTSILIAAGALLYAIGFIYTFRLGLETFPINEFGWKAVVGAFFPALLFPLFWTLALRGDAEVLHNEPSDK